jgi:hypothetical protein
MAVRRLSGGLTPELGAADGQAHQGRDEEHPGMRDPAGDTAIRTRTPTAAASLFSGAGANAAAAASGAGAVASSSDDQVAARGRSLGTSAEMVISCAAPASSSALRRHAQLGGAGPRTGLAGVAVPGAGEAWAGAFCVVITRSRETESGSCELSRRPDFPAHLMMSIDPGEPGAKTVPAT